MVEEARWAPLLADAYLSFPIAHSVLLHTSFFSEPQPRVSHGGGSIQNYKHRELVTGGWVGVGGLAGV